MEKAKIKVGRVKKMNETKAKYKAAINANEKKNKSKKIQANDRIIN